MSDRTKELILKLLIVIGMILLFMVFPGGILLSFLVSDQNTFEIIYNTILFAFFGTDILFIVLLPVFGGLKQKSVKAEKIEIGFKCYNDLLKFIHIALLDKGYLLQNKTSNSSDLDILVYVKKLKCWTLDCFTIIRVSELHEELIEKANEAITVILTEYYNGKQITDKINMISVFCVDRITPDFTKMVNSNLQQGLKNGRLVVGISFGKNNIYVAKQKGGFAITKYKRLRKLLFDIMNLNNQ